MPHNLIQKSWLVIRIQQANGFGLRDKILRSAFGIERTGKETMRCERCGAGTLVKPYDVDGYTGHLC